MCAIIRTLPVPRPRKLNENAVAIAPFSPAHASGGMGFAVRIPSAENHQHPVHLPAVLVITFRYAVLEHRIPVLRRFCLDDNRFHSKKQRE